MGDQNPHKVSIFRWRSISSSKGLYHVARRPYRHTTRLAMHRHDFAELFWLEQGDAKHVVNGQTETLRTGDMVFIRPDDTHTLRTIAKRPFVIVNVAVPCAYLETLRTRYYADPAQAAAWPWRDGDLPCTHRLRPADLDRLTGWSEQLSAMRQNPLELDAFMLDLFNILAQSAKPTTTLPAWLADALHQFENTEHFVGGPAALAVLADRSPEHVGRVIRQHLGVSATELINQLRMERAARLLRMTDRPILDVAMDCGIDNLSYFYRLFKATYQQTPRQYRLTEQSPIR